MGVTTKPRIGGALGLSTQGSLEHAYNRPTSRAPLNHCAWGWRDGSVVEGMYGRGPEFGSQHLVLVAHNHLLLQAPGDPITSEGICTSMHTTLRRHANIHNANPLKRNLSG